MERRSDAAISGASLSLLLVRNRKPTRAASRAPKPLLLRTRGQQGPGYKSPQLRDILWDWFADTRASVAGILSPKIVLVKAREIVARLLEGMRQTGCYAPFPIFAFGRLCLAPSLEEGQRGGFGDPT